MPASNLPEQIRIKAIRSRWALFIFAWILNTNAENSSENGSTTSPSDVRGSGDVVISRKCCKKVSTPKFVSAEPKNTGESCPARTFSKSKASLAPSSNSISSTKISWYSFVIKSSKPASPRLASTISTLCPLSPAINREMVFVLRSYTPLKFFPEPIGQFTGQVRIPSTFSIWSINSNGSIASRSILLINVKIGIPRMTQTLNNLIVCASTPLEPSITITAESAAINVR